MTGWPHFTENAWGTGLQAWLDPGVWLVSSVIYLCPSLCSALFRAGFVLRWVPLHPSRLILARERERVHSFWQCIQKSQGWRSLSLISQPHLIMCPSLSLLLLLGGGGCDSHGCSWSHMDSNWEIGHSSKKNRTLVILGSRVNRDSCCFLPSLPLELLYIPNLGVSVLLVWILPTQAFFPCSLSASWAISKSFLGLPFTPG